MLHSIAKKIGRRRLILAAAIACTLPGCKVGPDFHAPTTITRSSWNLAAHPLLQGEQARLDEWWVHFNDPTLQTLVFQTLNQNLTLREAAERISEARARRAVTTGQLYPQTQVVQGSFAKNQLSANVANFFAIPGIFEPDLSPDNWQIGAAASWEVDFWGKYRRSIEVADARLNESISAFHEARVLLIAELAANYVQMRTAEARINLARQNLAVQTKTLKIAEEKRDAGIGSGLDVSQAKINVGVTSAAIPVLEVVRLRASHRICTLLGRPPVDLCVEVGYTSHIPVPDKQLCFGVPADLLRRRPDVKRAEFELAAQSARIGVAQADFYPQISLNGNIGYAAEDFGKLFSSRSDVGLISPGFSWNLLNYGRIQNNVEAERAAFRVRCNSYHNAVINAAREAEDAQVAYILNHDRLASLDLAVRGASEAVDKAEQLYRAGEIDFGRVYILQAGLLEQQDALAQAQADIALSLIELFKAIGGGWESSPLPCPSPVRLVHLPVPPSR